MRGWLLSSFLAVGVGSPPAVLAQESRQLFQAELLKTIQARFAADKELQLKGGLQFMLAAAEK